MSLSSDRFGHSEMSPTMSSSNKSTEPCLLHRGARRPLPRVSGPRYSPRSIFHYISSVRFCCFSLFSINTLQTQRHISRLCNVDHMIETSESKLPYNLKTQTFSLEMSSLAPFKHLFTETVFALILPWNFSIFLCN